MCTCVYVCVHVCVYLKSTGDASLAKDRAEHAAMKKKRMQERATEQEKIKARRMQAGQVSFKAAAEKRVRSYVRVYLWAARKWAHPKKRRCAHTKRHRCAHTKRD